MILYTMDVIQKPVFLDCTIRDGGYVNRWHFSDECIRETIDTLDKIGYDFVEIGFRNKPEIYNNKPCGKWRYCTEEDIVKVVPAKSNRNIKIAVMVDYTSTDIELFTKVDDSVIDMVRVAFHIPDLKPAMEMCKQLKNLGYIVCANAMATMNYNEHQIEELCFLAHTNDVDYLYLADSYGCLSPDNIECILSSIKSNLPTNSNVKLGIHLHNNIQNAYANYLRVNDKQLVDIIDTTILGMGRGSGNLSTELVVYTDDRFNKQSLKNICILAEKHVLPFFGDQGKWGSNLQYIISAHFKCHPNYILKLQDYGIIDIAKVWMYIEHIFECKKHTMFDIDFLNATVAKNTAHSN